MSARYDVRTWDEMGRRTPWKPIDREHVPPPVQELLDPLEIAHVTIHSASEQTTTYRRTKGNT